MQETDRDSTLLARLTANDRAKVERVVDELIEEDIPRPDAIHLRATALAFDLHAESLSAQVRIVAMQVAAALRARASEVIVPH